MKVHILSTGRPADDIRMVERGARIPTWKERAAVCGNCGLTDDAAGIVGFDLNLFSVRAVA